MASIALSVIGCIDYLAYGTIFTCAMFRPKKKLEVFFLPEKPQMSAGVWCTVRFTIKTDIVALVQKHTYVDNSAVAAAMAAAQHCDVGGSLAVAWRWWQRGSDTAMTTMMTTTTMV
jgi:hypothetical protein